MLRIIEFECASFFFLLNVFLVTIENLVGKKFKVGKKFYTYDFLVGKKFKVTIEIIKKFDIYKINYIF